MSHLHEAAARQEKWDLRFLALGHYWSQYSKDPSND
jgi:hypothetical protein